MNKALISLLSLLFLLPVGARAQSAADQASYRLTPPALLRVASLPAASETVEIGGTLETGNVESDKAERKGGREQWFIGAYWHHLFVPQAIEKLFFTEAAPISTGLFKAEPNIGLLGTWRNAKGFAVQFGFGHHSYHFYGVFQKKGDEDIAAEFVKSTLDFWAANIAVLWTLKIVEEFGIELGFAGDLGLVTGDVVRDEAWYSRPEHKWYRCNSKYDTHLNGDGKDYCGDPKHGADTDPSGKFGEHYNVKVGTWSNGGDVPNIFFFPTIPMITLRFAPIRELVIKWEAGYGIAQFWTGFSIHGAVWTAPPPVIPPELRVVERPVVTPPPPPPAKGIIKGTVVEQDTRVPIEGAVVAFTDRADVASLKSQADGSFTSVEFDPGAVKMDITHPDYEPGKCEATIGEKGGESTVLCTLVALPKVGIIDGHVMGPSGPVAGASVSIDGPTTRTLATDSWGAFKVEDAAPGDYTARAMADGYIGKSVSFNVASKETTTVKIDLAAAPKFTMVKVEEKEIKIEQQINFATNKATIKSDSFPLMNEIAGAFKAYPDIRQVEIQGHTDSRGSDSYNMGLSQRRADAVRAWLINAGIEADRMTAKGYGETTPLESNQTREGRAKNRRVQFIIKERNKEFK